MKPDLVTRMRDLNNQLYNLARAELENRVRRILKGKNSAHEFYMAMGGSAFYDRDGHLIDKQFAYMDPVNDFLHEWDDTLKLTGDPMRIRGWDGPIITRW